MFNTILILLFILDPLTGQEMKANNTEIKRTNDYEFFINLIKISEGFAGGEKYKCPSGYMTIGYGHMIKKGEYFTTLTKMQADSLLRKDFDKRIDFVRKHTGLKGSKLYAIAHFVFKKGSGNFLRSTLFKKILNKESIDSEIVKWCYYTKNGEKKRSDRMYKNRLIELSKYKDEEI